MFTLRRVTLHPKLHTWSIKLILILNKAKICSTLVMKMAQNKMSYKKTISVATQTEAVNN